LGGGIGAADALTLTSCIVSGNSALDGGGIFHRLGTNLVLGQSKVADNISVRGLEISEF
jgi:hypothetical protein